MGTLYLEPTGSNRYMVCLLCLWFVGFGNYILKAAACSAVSMVIVMSLKLSIRCFVTVRVTNYTAVFTVFHTLHHLFMCLDIVLGSTRSLVS